nr:MAG TPA: hypothetical protein [Caudoviricetes sp.]
MIPKKLRLASTTFINVVMSLSAILVYSPFSRDRVDKRIQRDKI